MLDQGSPAWVRERVGKATASRQEDMQARLKRGKNEIAEKLAATFGNEILALDSGAARVEYAMQLVSERMADAATEFYVSEPMRWGIEQEAPAAEEYETATGEIVLAGIWVPHPQIEYYGATPDRFVGADGLLEIKCPTTRVFTQMRATREIPPRYVAQMTAQLACTRRRWCDFMAFDPRVVNGPHYWIKRFEPAAEEIEKCEAAARQFLAEVDRLFELVTTEA